MYDAERRERQKVLMTMSTFVVSYSEESETRLEQNIYIISNSFHNILFGYRHGSNIQIYISLQQKSFTKQNVIFLDHNSTGSKHSEIEYR